MSIVTALDKAVRTVCPIDGVSIGNPADKLTWRFVPTSAATQPQKDAAQGVIDAFAYDAVADASTTDQDMLNAVLIEDGSILRAVIAVLRSEINIVRAAVIPALPARTVAQVTAALKAQMRT